jgi:hypothetical protein
MSIYLYIYYPLEYAFDISHRAVSEEERTLVITVGDDDHIFGVARIPVDEFIGRKERFWVTLVKEEETEEEKKVELSSGIEVGKNIIDVDLELEFITFDPEVGEDVSGDEEEGEENEEEGENA